MAKKDKVYIPMSTGGLIRYSEEEKQLFKLKPKHIIYMVIAIVIFEIAIKIILG